MGEEIESTIDVFKSGDPEKVGVARRQWLRKNIE
jgi:hypothetical protein